MTATPLQLDASGRFVAAAQRLPTLFDLEEDAYRLMALLEDLVAQDEAGAVYQQIAEELALVDQLLVEKTESYVSVIRSLEAMSAARKAEADRLRERAASAAKHADFLKNRLLTHLQATGRQRVETARFTLTVRTNPQSVVVVNPAEVPHEYERTRIEVSIDKKAILEHVRSTGEVIPGIAIQRTERLDIR